MSRFARRIDDNHAAIVGALRKLGHRVHSLAAAGNGIPDLLVCTRAECRLVLLEVKRQRNKRGDLEALTPAEAAFHRSWQGAPVFVVGTVEDAIAAIEGRPTAEVCW